MRRLRMVSIAMTLAGIALAVGAAGFGLGPMWTLTGLMMVVAGVVKLATVAIWHGAAGLGPIKATEDESTAVAE